MLSISPIQYSNNIQFGNKARYKAALEVFELRNSVTEKENAVKLIRKELDEAMTTLRELKSKLAKKEEEYKSHSTLFSNFSKDVKKGKKLQEIESELYLSDITYPSDPGGFHDNPWW